VDREVVAPEKKSGVPAVSWPMLVTVKTLEATEATRNCDSDVEEGLSHFPGYAVPVQPQYAAVSP